MMETDLSAEIDELEALNKKLQDTIKTVKDDLANVTIRVGDARKMINVLSGQIEALNQLEKEDSV